MADTATLDIPKLSVSECHEALVELKSETIALSEQSELTPEEEATLTDKLDLADQLQAALSEKKDVEQKRRLDRLRRFDSEPTPRKTGETSAAVDEFDGFGDRLAAVARFRISGHMDQRLKNALGANEATPSDGGFLIGSDAETELMSKVYGDSQILSRVQRTPISAASNMLKLRQLKETSRADGSRQGGVQAYWADEAAAVTASQREYEEIELTLKKLMATSYASEEMLEDHVALAAETSVGFTEELTFKLEDSIINGDGVGKCLGILNSPSKVTVSLETGQTASDPLNYDNITQMWARLHSRSQSNAIWLIDQTLWPALFTMGLTNGTAGTPVYLPPNGAADAPFGTLFGRPVFSTEFTSAKNTEGDIILWDPTSYRLIEKGGVRGSSSIHVAFLTGEEVFKFTHRVNGAPKWRSALTPKNGGDTLSTIVTLATRT